MLSRFLTAMYLVNTVYLLSTYLFTKQKYALKSEQFKSRLVFVLWRLCLQKSTFLWFDLGYSVSKAPISTYSAKRSRNLCFSQYTNCLIINFWISLHETSLQNKLFANLFAVLLFVFLANFPRIYVAAHIFRFINYCRSFFF